MRRTLTLALLLWTGCGNPRADLGGAPSEAGGAPDAEAGADAGDATAGDATRNEGGGGDGSGDGSRDGSGDASINDGGKSDAMDAAFDVTDGPSFDGNILCDAPTPGSYYVDPVNGSDSSTGSNTTEGHVAGACAFKTITHALSVVGSPSAATTITVLGPAHVVSGEAYPLNVPANVVIKGAGTGTVEVDLPNTIDQLVFALVGPSSGIESMTIVGTTAAIAGIAAYGGTNPGDGGTNAYVKNVTVRDFPNGFGIGVTDNGLIELDEGVTLTSNKAGLYLDLSGTAVSSNTNQSNPVNFSNNSDYGVVVLMSASVHFVGSPGTLGAGSIVATGNGAGFAIEQQGPSSKMPLNTLNGVVAYNNTAVLTPGDGILLEGGSVAVVRNSYLGANYAGIRITAGSGPNYDTSGIDLGTTSSFGMNFLQAPGFGGIGDPNHGAALCVDIPQTESQNVYAQGNTWADSTNMVSLDCSTVATDAGAAGALSVSNTCVGTEADLGGQGFNPGSKLSVYVDGCTCPNGACQ
jgi:hypothetical protein